MLKISYISNILFKNLETCLHYIFLENFKFLTSGLGLDLAISGLGLGLDLAVSGLDLDLEVAGLVNNTAT